jgi:hypothetical protein
MPDPTWTTLTLKTKKVLAKPDALWTLVYEYIKGPVKLKIEAKGTWEYSPTKACSPDGSREAGIVSDSLNSSAPVGTLIFKVGGSPAEKPASSFVAGSYTVVALDEKAEGGLFFTMNDQIGQFVEHDKDVEITVQQARS